MGVVKPKPHKSLRKLPSLASMSDHDILQHGRKHDLGGDGSFRFWIIEFDVDIVFVNLSF